MGGTAAVSAQPCHSARPATRSPVCGPVPSAAAWTTSPATSWPGCQSLAPGDERQLAPVDGERADGEQRFVRRRGRRTDLAAVGERGAFGVATMASMSRGS